MPRGENGESKREKIWQELWEGDEAPFRAVFVDLETKEPLVALLNRESSENTGVEDPKPVKIIPIRSSDFRKLLVSEIHGVTGEIPSETLVREVSMLLEGEALQAGERRLGLRVFQPEEGRICYDLQKASRYVEITADGWQVKLHTEGEPLLKILPHQLPQVEPVPAEAERFREMLNFVRIPDGGTQIVFLSAILSYFLPEIPRPIIIFHGPQGAAKTFTTRLIKRLVDPSALETAAVYRLEELPRVLARHYLVALDNLSSLSQEAQDILCRAVTGGGLAKRRLYTDDDDVILRFRRALVLNGINVPGLSPDFLDRAILIELDRIPPEERRSEAELLKEFERALPELLGAAFSAISEAMGLIGEVRAEFEGRPKQRLVDFTIWGEALARALGFQKGAFTAAYAQLCASINREAVEGDVVGELLLRLMEGQESWSGTATELLSELKEVARSLGIGESGLPRAPNSLSRRINRLKVSLREVGMLVEYTRSPGADRKRIISIYRPNRPIVQSSPGGGLDDTLDDIVQSSEYRPTPADVSRSRKCHHGGRSDDKDDKVHVRFLTPVPEFLLPDGTTTVGPFKPGDVATLPARCAVPFVKRGEAEVLSEEGGEDG